MLPLQLMHLRDGLHAQPMNDFTNWLKSAPVQVGWQRMQQTPGLHPSSRAG